MVQKLLYGSCVIGVNTCILVAMVDYRVRGRALRTIAVSTVALVMLVALCVAAAMQRGAAGGGLFGGAAPHPVAEVSGAGDVRNYISAELAARPQGVDASKWQHPSSDAVDWEQAAAAGKTFAFLKATDNDQRGNDYFDDDVRAARQAGLVVGAYHKAHPGSDATRQAEVFSAAVLEAGGEQLPPVLDLEIDEGLSPTQLQAWTRTFLEKVEDTTGRRPILYTYKYFWLVQMGNTTDFSEYPLWLAEYRQQQPSEPLIGGWDQWTFWQFAGNDGRSGGFSTAVDLNVFHGSEEELRALVGPVGVGGEQGAGGDSTSSGATSPGATSPGAASAETTPAPDASTSPVDSSTSPDAADSTTASPTTVPRSPSSPGSLSDEPLRITIPDIGIPQNRLPAGIKLPLTITLPAELLGSLGTGSTDGIVSDFQFVLDLIGALPPEALKSVRLG